MLTHYISRWPFNDVIHLATFVTITEKAEMPQRLSLQFMDFPIYLAEKTRIIRMDF